MTTVAELLVPDIGDFTDVPIIELLVSPGDVLTPETPVVTIESDKASMDVPAEVNGVVTEVLVGLGDTISEGSLLLCYETTGTETGSDRCVKDPEEAQMRPTENRLEAPRRLPVSSVPQTSDRQSKSRKSSGHASPSVRRLARELGVDLGQVIGSGPKGRIKKEDIRSHVKQILQRDGKLVVPVKDVPDIDFSAFGEIETSPLSHIQTISGQQLAKNWTRIPHVTSCDDADITEIESFRKQLNSEQPVKLTLLPFLIKAVQLALQSFPQLNSSLQGDQLILKKYFHIGFAVDTPQGLLVPVIRDVNNKGILHIAAEIGDLAELAREGRLNPSQMQGGTFTISSLGNIGGTNFTPIINAPEVAILALGRAAHKPVWDGNQFIPRLILPLSLSWDHRALDGVTASRFNVALCRLLADARRMIL